MAIDAASTLHRKSEWLVQPEAQAGLGRKDEVLLAGQSGYRCTGSGADRSADKRSLAASSNGPNEGAAASTATDQGEIALLMVSAEATDRVRVLFVRCSVHLQRVERQPELRHAT